MYLYKRDHAGTGRTVICTVFSCEVRVVLKTTPPLPTHKTYFLSIVTRFGLKQKTLSDFWDTPTSE
jgi:hypothetical protein